MREPVLHSPLLAPSSLAGSTFRLLATNDSAHRQQCRPQTRTSLVASRPDSAPTPADRRVARRRPAILPQALPIRQRRCQTAPNPPLIPASCSPVRNTPFKTASGGISLNDSRYGISWTKSASDLVVAAIVSSADPAGCRYRYVTSLASISQTLQRDILPRPPDQPRTQ